MRRPGTLENLLSEIPDDAPERVFFLNAYELIMALGLPMQEKYGLACIGALELSQVHFRDGRKLGIEPYTGGIGDYAMVVAIVFSAVKDDHVWWKSCYPSRMGDRYVERAVDEIVERIKKVPFVERFEYWQREQS